MSKRKVFNELMEGITAMKDHREGKITLRNHEVAAVPLPTGSRVCTYKP